MRHMLHQSFLQQLEAAAAIFPAQLIAAAAAGQGGQSPGATPLNAHSADEALNLSTKSSSNKKDKKDESTLSKKLQKEPENLPFNDLMAMAALPAGIVWGAIFLFFGGNIGIGWGAFIHWFFCGKFLNF